MSKKYRFTKKDLKTIQDFANLINEDIKVGLSYRFECDVYEDTIYLSNKRWTKLDEYFDKWFRQQPEYTPINYTLICILHEIGHIMTQDDDLLEQGYKLNEMYNFLYEMEVISEEELNFSYFNIESERLATMWGVQFYKDNKELCDKLAEEVGLCSH